MNGCKIGFVVLTELVLMGCMGDGSSNYPPLVESGLVGCWTRLTPFTATNCIEECFSKSGKFYDKTLDIPNGGLANPFRETVGLYARKGDNGIKFTGRVKRNFEITVNTLEYNDNYSIIRDTLNDIANNGVLFP